MQCNIFISLLSSGWADKIIAQIVKWGFEVAPLTTSGYLLTSSDSPCSVLSLRVGGIADGKQGDFRDYIRKYLTDNDIYYYSIVISTMNGGAAWLGSNISLSKMKAKKKEKKEVPYLRVVRTTPPPLPSESNLPPSE